MKPIRFTFHVCVIVTCVFSAALHAQERTITFSGVKEATSAPVTLDSIRISNLTRGRDTLLIGSNSFVIDWLSGMPSSQNAPLEFMLRGGFGHTSEAGDMVFVTMPRRATVRVAVYNILGAEIAALSPVLEAGNHAFLFDAGGMARGTYIVTASMDNISRALSIPVLRNSLGGAARITYAGPYASSYAGPSAAQAPQPGNAFMDTYTFIGYAKGSYPDTLANVVPEPGRRYEFSFTPLPENGLITGPSVDVASVSLSPDGGVLTVTEPNTPVTGLEISVPRLSYADERTFTVSYAEILNHGFDAKINILSPLVTLSNGGGYADSAMLIKIPIRLPAGHFAMAFFYDRDTRTLEGIPIVALTDDAVYVATRHLTTDHLGFAKTAGQRMRAWIDVLVAGIKTEELTGTITTTFAPGVDDWEYSNWGSYLAPNGHCTGQSLTAMWYFVNKKLRFGAAPLHDLLDEVHADSMWMDNTRGYRFSSVVWKGLRWQDRSNWLANYFEQVGKNRISKDSLHYLAFAFAMRNTGHPQLTEIWRFDRGWSGHAMIVYGTDKGSLLIADPNYPGAQRGTKLELGKFLPYSSGDNAGVVGSNYPWIQYIANSAIVPTGDIAERWKQTFDGTIGDIPPNVFPQTEVFMLKNNRPESLPESIETTESELQIFATCPTCADRLASDRTPLRLTDEQGRFVTWSDADGILRIPVSSGTTKYGLTVYGYSGAGKTGRGYIDFHWLEVTGKGYRGTGRIQCGPIDVHIRAEYDSSGKQVVSYLDEVQWNTSMGPFGTGSLSNGVYSSDTTIVGEGFEFVNTISFTFNDSLTVIQDFIITQFYEQTDDWTDTKTIRGGNFRIKTDGSNPNFDEFLFEGPDVCSHITEYTYVYSRLDKVYTQFLESYKCRPETKISIGMRKK